MHNQSAVHTDKDFIRHAVQSLNVIYLALLLPSNYFHTDKRTVLWQDCTPARIYPLTWRPDFQGKKNPVMTFSWIVWADTPSLYGCELCMALRNPKKLKYLQQDLLK